LDTGDTVLLRMMVVPWFFSWAFWWTASELCKDCLCHLLFSWSCIWQMHAYMSKQAL
jgi:hypothetical protein